MRVLLSLVIVGLFASCVSAQAYLNEPMPIYLNATTVGPCGNASSDTMATVVPTDLVNFGQLLVNYTTSGNQGGQTWCRFAFAETIDQAAFDNGIFFEYSPCDDSAVYNLTSWYDGLGENGTDTLVYLQFTWYDGAATTWYSCGQVLLHPANFSVTTLSNSVSDTGNAVPYQNEYFKTPLPQGQFLAVEVTTPASGSLYVVGALNDFANENNYRLAFEALGEMLTVDALTVNDIQNFTAFITVGSNKTSGSFNIKTYNYNGYARYLSPAPQIADSLAGAGRKIYYTDSYSTVDTPKKIVVTATSGSPSLSVDQSLDGVNWGDSITTGTGTVCEPLGTQDQVKYISVRSSTATSFTLSLENGLCSTEPSKATKSVVSVFIVSVMFLVFLL